ncbi:MAG: CHAT domain-containing protein [Acidobacteria bacterium]|nr:CHAT domain-containing protein [Acidobacteriota bacterium]
MFASCVAWLLLLVLGVVPAARGQSSGAPANGTAAAPLNATRTLRPGEASEREIRGGEVQVFRVSLEAGQCARLVIERRGVDLLVAVAPPDGGLPIKFGNPAGSSSPVFVTFASDAAAGYTVEVHPVSKWAAAGRYVIRFEEARARSPLDEKRLAAARRLAEGRRLQLLEQDDARRAALAEYQAALALWEELQDNFEVANTLHFIAQTYRAMNNFDESRRYYELALQRRGDSDPQSLAFTLVDYGVAQRELKDPLEAVKKFERALELFRQARNQRGEAAALSGIGLSYMRRWEMSKAVEYLRPALELFRAEGDRHEEARTLNMLGGTADNLLKPQEAMAYYEEAIKGWEATGDLARKGNTQNNLGKLHDDFGEWQKALEYYDLALANYDAGEAVDEGQRATIREMRASTLYNIGYAYIIFGDFDKAQDYLRQSLARRETARGHGMTRTQMAYAHVQAGEPRLALEQCQLALPLLESVKDPRQAQTLTVMGMAYEALGEYQTALDKYQEALKLQQEDLQGQARTLTKMGDAYAALGRPDDALQKFARARELWHSFAEREGEALALFGAARVERKRGNHEVALKQTEAALELVEPLRSNITNRQLRASYFATKVGYYELYIDLLMHGGEAQAVAAFEASERARARSLLDLLSDARIGEVAGADPSLTALVEKRRLLLLEMRATLRRRTEAIAEKKGAEVVAVLDRESQKLDVARDRLEAQVKSAHPRYAALMFPKPLGAAEVQRMLDADTLLLEFFLGEERSYVWALSAGGVSGHALPPRREIEAAARRLKELLSKGKPLPNETAAARHARLKDATTEYWREAPAFSRMLLGPVASQLKGKRLLVVADGELMYLPFGALPSPESAAPQTSVTPTPLIARQLVVNLPSASVLSALRQTTRRSAAKSVAVFADPVVEADDPRIQEARRPAPLQSPNRRRAELAQAVRDIGEDGDETKLSRLPASLQEARNILSVAPRGRHLEATGFDANREKATNPGLGRYSVVHFATHGILNEKHPELSGLVLSLYDREGRFREDGFLRLSDIYSFSLPVDLVVLSACRTGLGKEVRGEGLIGLTRGFMYAGAPRVVASLWQVDDEATAQLMRLFYQKMFKEGMSAAEALKAAQVSLSGEKRWNSPYYWAGFVLQGDWR